MAGELDPLSELRFLTEALRAHAEWQQACGGSALPPSSSQLSVVSSQLVPSTSAPPRVEPVRLERPEPPRERAPSPAPPPKLPTANSQLPTEERHARLTVLADEV